MPATFRTFFSQLLDGAAGLVPPRPGGRSGFYVETLELRRLLAGQVIVDIDADGNMDIRGDSRDNHLEMVDDGDTLIIRGLESTQIRSNGQSVQELAIVNTTGDVHGRFNLRLRGGDDRLVTRSVDFRAEASFDLGSGDDQLVLNQNAPGDPSFDATLNIATGSGRNFVDAPAEVAALFTLDLRGKENTIRLDELDAAGGVRINGRGGNEFVMLEDVAVEGVLEINLGAGSDAVEVSGESFVRGNTFVDLGSSRKSDGLPLDFLRFETGATHELILLYGALEISQSGGASRVEFNAETGQVQVEGDTLLNLGVGSDSFALNAEGSGIDGVYFDGQFDLDTGGGDDSIQLVTASKEIVAFGGATSMTLAAGNDTTDIERIAFDFELAIDMGSGNDELTLDDTSTRELTVWMGGGRDQSSLVSVFFGGNSNLDGGSGFDTSLVEDIAVLSPGPTTKFVNFELRP